MLRRSFLIFALVATAALFPSDITYGQTAGNAAELYRQAFQAAPTSPQVLAILKAEQPPLEDASKALEEGARSLALIHQATSISKCDWGIDTSGRSRVDLAFLSPAKTLHALMRLQASSQMADGKSREAAATLADMMVMGRRIEGIDLLVTKLLGLAFENGAIDRAAEDLPRFEPRSVRLLSETFQKLPAPASLDDAAAAEKRISHQEVKPESLSIPKAAELQNEVIRAMFAAALAAPKGGEANFKSTRDPVGGKPFGYRTLDEGYELSSPGQYRGQTIKLVVGKPEKQAAK